MKSIDLETLRRWLDDEHEFTLVDTLPESSFMEGHIPGAIHIVSDEIIEKASERLPDKNADIVVYCASPDCKRAVLSTERLESLGYTKVQRFPGGLKEWKEAGLPLSSTLTGSYMATPEKTRRLTRQVALVTGGDSGIGEGIVREMASAGAAVAINYISDPEDAEKIADEIRQSGGRAIAVEGDVSDEKSVLNMFSAVKDAFGTLDILVSNAGIQKDNTFTEMTLEEWNSVLEVNLTGAFLCSREAAREFMSRSRDDVCKVRGKIIFISSVHETIPWAGHVNYAASKGGLNLLMRSIAQELAPHKVRVNSILPGAIKTPINKEAWETDEAHKELLELIPYKRIGVPEDIGKVAVWLASDESDYVTGTGIVADGGMLLYPAFLGAG